MRRFPIASRSKRADRATVENTFNFRIENAFEDAVSELVPEEQQEEFLSHVRLSTDVDWAEDLTKKIESTVSSLYDSWQGSHSPEMGEGRFPSMPEEDFDETPLEDDDAFEQGQLIDEFDEDFDETVIEEPNPKGRPKKSG